MRFFVLVKIEGKNIETNKYYCDFLNMVFLKTFPSQQKIKACCLKPNFMCLKLLQSNKLQLNRDLLRLDLK